MLKKMFAGVAVLVGAFVAMTGSASAHLHEITTPGGNAVTIPCEPFHGTTPGQSQHSANWDADRGLHPIHHGLHLSPATGREITVAVVSSTCP